MSRQNITLLTLTVIAAGVVGAHRAVGYGGAQASAQGQKVMGVSQCPAVAGEAVGLVSSGTAVVESGAAFDVGQSLIVDSQGRAIPSIGALALAAGAVAVTSSAANGAILHGGEMPEYVFADALQAASKAGEFVEILLRR
ncbi:MAG: DUF2190 family protein [Magnetococcales bacterium]|nr:DUF2190 family protein [Magnetococcales bacterium]MBF0114693.1 DUF2190 family protein [Magnetococcales bacterium]